MPNDDVDSKGTGDSTSRSGEDIREHEGKEPGRQDIAPTGGAQRPAGTSTARDSTGVDPQDPIDEESPNLQTGD